ncbi:MAG: thioredoxin family protein [Sulfolobaceae archaeon]
MKKVEIFIHRNCVDCNILLDWLEQKNLLGKVQVIDTELYPFLALERGVLSTPSIFVDGKLYFAGVVDYDELERILEFDTVPVKSNLDKEKLVEKLMEGITNSFAVTAWIYVNRDFDALFAQKEFIMAITGLVNSSNSEELYNYLRTIMLKEGEKYLEKWKDVMIRRIATNFVRELYWLYNRKIDAEEVKRKYPLETFAHWLMIRGGAVGRVGLRIHSLSNVNVLSRIAEVYDYLFKNYDELWFKVIQEQDKIKERESKRMLTL